MADQMGLDRAAELLEGMWRFTLKDSAWSDAEVTWRQEDGETGAFAHFGPKGDSVYVIDPDDPERTRSFSFEGADARFLRRCGIEAGTEENAEAYVNDIRSSYEESGDVDTDDDENTVRESVDDAWDDDYWDLEDDVDKPEDLSDGSDESSDEDFGEPWDQPDLRRRRRVWTTLSKLLSRWLGSSSA